MLLKTIAELKRYVALDAKGILSSFALELKVSSRRSFGRCWAGRSTPGCSRSTTRLASTWRDLAAQLLRTVQASAVATNITMHLASIDETGVHIVSTDKSKTAFQWQTNAMQTLLSKRGNLGLDALVTWLEEHRDGSPELRVWAGFTAGQRHRRELFICTNNLCKYKKISESSQVFLVLDPQRRKLETLELGRVLGYDFLEELREQVCTRTLTSENESLLCAYVYPALASLIIGCAPGEHGLRLSGDGIDLAIARLDNSTFKEANASLNVLLQQKTNMALLDADRFMRRLTDHLDFAASATRYATYFGSRAYTAPNQPVGPVNTPEAKIYKFC